MPQDVKIISSRRAYEFRVDDLRLTMLSNAPAVRNIQSAFGFQGVALATPPSIFGTVPGTVPPGLVFQIGAWAAAEGDQVIPIRFLHVEPRRIVIDVAGPSTHINGIYADLMAVANQMTAPDGTPIIGEPAEILDYSELTARFEVALDAWVPVSMRDVIRRGLQLDGKNANLGLVPTFTAEAVNNQEEYPGLTALSARYLQFALRAGSTPENPVYFSAAPLDSDAHLAYLNDLEQAIQSVPQGVAATRSR